MGLFDRIKHNDEMLHTKQFSEPAQRTFYIIEGRLYNRDKQDVWYHGWIIAGDRALLFTKGELEDELTVDEFKKTYPTLWELVW